jgi:hypothetical protein
MNNMNKKTVEFRSHCSICETSYNEGDGGTQGHFGDTPVTFCKWCFSVVVDMVEQTKDEPCGMSRTWQHR